MPIDDEGNITGHDEGLVMTPRGPRAADPWEMPVHRKPIEAWVDSDVEQVRREIHEVVGPHVKVELEEATRSTFDRKQVYLMLIGGVGIFKSRDDILGMVTYAVSNPPHSPTEERYGTREGALHRVIEILKSKGET